jgi:hypothetical protein
MVAPSGNHAHATDGRQDGERLPVQGHRGLGGNSSNTSFAGGTKQDTNCPSVGTGKPPNKDDLKRIYLSSKTLPSNGHTFLDLAWVRIPQNTTSSSAHVGFEFNQGSTACPAGSDGLVQRTAGDILIVYDFEGGSSPVVLTLRKWVTAANATCEVGSSKPPCWGVAQNLTTGGFAEGAVNAGTPVQDALTPPALSSIPPEPRSRRVWETPSLARQAST